MQSPFAVVLCSQRFSVKARWDVLSLWHWVHNLLWGWVNFPGMPPPVLKTVVAVLMRPGVLNELVLSWQGEHVPAAQTGCENKRLLVSGSVASGTMSGGGRGGGAAVLRLWQLLLLLQGEGRL